jgi:GNAT superfamily N-acetyltransferase
MMPEQPASTQTPATPTPHRTPLLMPKPARAPLPVIQADLADVPGVAAVIANAFWDLPQSRWIVPDDTERRRTFFNWCVLQVEDAVNFGTVHAWVTPGREIHGAALWRWAPGLTDGPNPGEYDERLAEATDLWVDRYRQFEQAVEKNAPPDGTAQVHLWMIGVREEHRSAGIGSHLLGMMHEALDGSHYTAYLEAADLRSRALYLRTGYIDAGPAYHLPDCAPPFLPMLRHPAQPAT